MIIIIFQLLLIINKSICVTKSGSQVNPRADRCMTRLFCLVFRHHFV